MNKKISQLPNATTPLTGNEKAEIVQGGINKQVDVSEFGGNGAVTSVNGQTGLVVLGAEDVGADPEGTAAALLTSSITNGDTTHAPNGDAVFDALAAKSAVFVETATAYVDSAGSDVTGTVGRSDLPYATITGALQANTGVTYLRIKIGFGTYTSPAQADLRSNLWLEGSGKPGYNNTYTLTTSTAITITDPTALIGGTILQGQVYFQDKSNVHITDLGVDCGSAFVTGGGTEANQLIFLSATTNFNFSLMRNIVIKNVTTLGRTASSAFHGIQIENAYRPIVENCDTYFSTHGIVYKTFGGIINNVRCHLHTLDAIVLKTDTYAIGWLTQVSNFEIHGGGGILIHLGSGTSTGGIGCKISNGVMRSPTYGLRSTSDTSAIIHYIEINNVKVHGSTGIGFDLEETQSAQITGCVALGCTTGFKILDAATSTFCAVRSCHAEACTTGFDISATSSSAIIQNCSARGNTTGYTFTGTIYSSGLTWDNNSSNFSGSVLPIQMERGRYFFGGTSSPTALVHINSGSTSLAPFKIAAGALLTSALGGSAEYGPDTTTGAYYFTKASDLRHGVGGVIYDSFADVQNSGTSETDMFSYTTPANTLAGNGEKLRAKYAGTFNDNTATAQMKVMFDGQTAFDSGALTIANTGSWEIDVLIVRTGSTTARSIVTMSTNCVTTRTYTTQTDLTSLTLTTTSILKLTATAGGGGGGSNDITGKMATVSWFPVAAN